MERMHEIMKARVLAEKAFNEFNTAHQNALDRLDKEMAIVGPVKIGDIVVATGFSYCGKEMIVDRLWITNHGLKPGVQAMGRVLNRGGTPGLNKADYFIEVAVAP